MMLLPVELRALLMQLPGLRQNPSLPLPLPSRRAVSFAATISRANALRQADSDSAPAREHDGPDSGAGLFEPATPEYAVVPLSTLDHPPELARSPKQALSRLVLQRRFDEADAIIADIIAANHPPLGSESTSLENRFLSRHARRLFRESRDSNWLAWWQVIHRVPADSVPEWLRGASHHEKLARQICDRLAFEGDVARIEAFALVAADAGFERLIASKFLVHLALYAPRDAGERVWRRCLETLRQRKVIARRETKSRLLKARVAADESFLAAWRAGMIKAHLSMARIEYAVSLLTAPADELCIASASVGSKIYLDTLHYTAAAGRFDLFLVTFRHLENHSKRLVRAVARVETNPRTGERFYTRAAPRAVPATLEAITAIFDSYREAGAPTHEPPSSSDSAVAELSDPTAAGQTPSPEEFDYHAAAQVLRRRFNSKGNIDVDTALTAALVVDDVRGASRIIDQALRMGWAPSLLHTAHYINMLRSRGHKIILDTVPRALADSRGAKGDWMSRFWASATMLANVRELRYEDAIATFTSSFQLAGLPDPVRKALVAIAPAPNVPFNDELPPRPLAIPSHALSIAFEALIPHLVAGQERMPDSTAMVLPPAIDDLYACISSPTTEFNIIHPTRLATGFDPSASPLYPSTFVPFLLAFARARRPPLTLLHVIRDMQRLGVPRTMHHWGVVAGAFARTGSPADTTYLLDVLRRRTPSTTPDPALEALLDELTIPDVPPNTVIYTTMIRGLTLQAEYDAAWDVADRMPFDGADDPVLQKVFAKLAMAGGRRRRRVAPSTAE